MKSRVADPETVDTDPDPTCEKKTEFFFFSILSIVEEEVNIFEILLQYR